MKNYRQLIFAVCSCITVLGCVPPPPPAPIYSAPIEVPFEKLAQPAFADDYADKAVRFDAVYLASMGTLVDLPSEYQQGFVRIILMRGTSTSNNVLVPKELADPALVLKVGQNVRVTAYAQLTRQFSIAGGQQHSLLFIANSITPLEPQVSKPQAQKPKHKSKH